MAKSKHLVKWKENEHQTKPKEAGCLWRHADYDDKKYPRCNYRKIAHEYSTANEPHIYNVPNFRSGEVTVRFWSKYLGPVVSKGGKPLAARPADPVGTAWHLGTPPNFKTDKRPYWHNTHHCIACGEITNAFSVAERKLILATRWNINEMPNVIILPKQDTVATILRLPTHVPPSGAQNHSNYSGQLTTGLRQIKGSFSSNEDEEKHPLDDESAPSCRDALQNISKQLREFLVTIGDHTPGIDIDSLSLSSINWGGR